MPSLPALIATIAAALSATARDRRRAARPPSGGRAARHRAPRSSRLPPRAHPRVLPHRDPDGRRLRRARPRLDQGRRARRAPREPDHRHHRRGEPPRVRRSEDHQGRRRRPRSPAGSPRTSPWPSSRRSARRSGCPPYARPTRGTTGSSKCPPSTRCSTLVQRESARTHRTIGVYPGDQAPVVLPLDRAAPRAAGCWTSCTATGWTSRGSHVFLQSFETGNLRELNQRTQLPIIQLLDSAGAPWDLRSKGDPRTYQDLTTPAQLRQIASYADGIGPNKDLVIPRDGTGHALPPSHLVQRRPPLRPARAHLHLAPREPVHGRRLPPRQRPQRRRRPRGGDPCLPRRRRRRDCSPTTPTSPVADPRSLGALGPEGGVRLPATPRSPAGRR